MPLRKAGTITGVSAPAEEQDKLPPSLAPQIAKYPGLVSNAADAKGRQISRQGLFQAALQSPAIMQYAPDIATYLGLVGLVAEAGLGFVNESASNMGDAIAKAAALVKR